MHPPADFLDFLGNDTRPSSRSHPDNSIPVQVKSPFAAFLSQRNDESDVDDSDNEDVPTRASSRKRGRSHRSDTFRNIRKVTRRRHTSKSPELGCNKLPTAANQEDSDDTVVTLLTSQSRRSTIVASKTSRGFRGASPSPSENLASGSPYGGASDLDDSVQRNNDHVGSSLTENTTQPSHGGRVPSPALDWSVRTNTDNQRTHSRKGKEVGGSSPSMHPSPSRSNFGHPIQARKLSPGPAINIRVEIFVIAPCGSGNVIKKWPGGTLSDKKLSTIFDELSTLISRSDIERIHFKLKTLKKQDEMECLVERGDMAFFEFMIQSFDELITERKEAGEARVRMLLTPHLERQGRAIRAEIPRDSEINGHDW